MAELEKEANETARQYALRVLRHKIINLDLKPGQFISESEIGEQLGLSRTPVREAFQDLANAAIVEVQPQKGTFVSLIDMDMVEEARFLRNVLEEVVVRLVCDSASREDIEALEENVLLQELVIKRGDHNRFYHLDNSFHEQLFKACGKVRTYDFIGGMMIHFNRIRMLNLKEVDMTGPLSDHKYLLSAIRDGNKQSAVAVMDRHLTRVNSDKIYLYDRHPEYFKNVEPNINKEGTLCVSAVVNNTAKS